MPCVRAARRIPLPETIAASDRHRSKRTIKPGFHEGDPENRAGLIAHAASRTLDDGHGGLQHVNCKSDFPQSMAFKAELAAHLGQVVGLDQQVPT